MRGFHLAFLLSIPYITTQIYLPIKTYFHLIYPKFSIHNYKKRGCVKMYVNTN